MNELTREVVTKVAQKNKSAARDNGDLFAHFVRSAWWDVLMDLHGVDKKQRFLHLFSLWRPGLFEDGFLKDYDAAVFDLDVEISHRIKDMLERKIKRHPELQLTDWGDLPQRIAQPQMNLF